MRNAGESYIGRGLLLFNGGSEVCVPEIPSLEKEGFTHRLGQCVSETIPEIQLGRMPAPLAKIPVSLAGGQRLLCSDCLNRERSFAKEIVEPPARHWVPASIDYSRRLYVIHCRYAADSCIRDCDGERCSIRFVAKNGHYR